MANKAEAYPFRDFSLIGITMQQRTILITSVPRTVVGTKKAVPVSFALWDPNRTRIGLKIEMAVKTSNEILSTTRPSYHGFFVPGGMTKETREEQSKVEDIRKNPVQAGNFSYDLPLGPLSSKNSLLATFLHSYSVSYGARGAGSLLYLLSKRTTKTDSVTLFLYEQRHTLEQISSEYY